MGFFDVTGATEPQKVLVDKILELMEQIPAMRNIRAEPESALMQKLNGDFKKKFSFTVLSYSGDEIHRAGFQEHAQRIEKLPENSKGKTLFEEWMGAIREIFERQCVGGDNDPAAINTLREKGQIAATALKNLDRTLYKSIANIGHRAESLVEQRAVAVHLAASASSQLPKLFEIAPHIGEQRITPLQDLAFRALVDMVATTIKQNIGDLPQNSPETIREKLEPLWSRALYTKEELKKARREADANPERAEALREKARRKALKHEINFVETSDTLPPASSVPPLVTVKKLGRDAEAKLQQQNDKTGKAEQISSEIVALEASHPKDAAHKELKAILLSGKNLEAAKVLGDVNGTQPKKHGDNIETNIIALLHNNPGLADSAKQAPLLVAVAVSREKFENHLELTNKDMPGFFGGKPAKMEEVISDISKTLSDMGSSEVHEGWGKAYRREYLAYLAGELIKSATGQEVGQAKA